MLSACPSIPGEILPPLAQALRASCKLRLVVLRSPSGRQERNFDTV